MLLVKKIAGYPAKSVSGASPPDHLRISYIFVGSGEETADSYGRASLNYKYIYAGVWMIFTKIAYLLIF